MKFISGYGLPLTEERTFLTMPVGARILSAQAGPARVRLWVLAEMGAPTERVGFQLVSTAHPFQGDDLAYVETLQFLFGEVVWHLFRVCKPERAGAAVSPTGEGS